MSTAQPGRVLKIYRYPVKGLSPQPLDSTQLNTGETITLDRAWAIENGNGRFDAQAPCHLPKINFVMLMRDEKLASLDVRFDEDTQTLTILRNGKQVSRGQLSTKLGRQMIEQFLAAYMGSSLRGAPRIVSAPGHSISDVSAKCLHIVNLATLRELERVAGREINPIRFRPNLVVDDLEPWSEFKLVGETIGVGSARLSVFSKTQRCAATNVDPATANRDMAIPALLERTWGHTDFGVYATVETGGAIAVGDLVTR